MSKSKQETRDAQGRRERASWSPFKSEEVKKKPERKTKKVTEKRCRGKSSEKWGGESMDKKRTGTGAPLTCGSNRIRTPWSGTLNETR